VKHNLGLFLSFGETVLRRMQKAFTEKYASGKQLEKITLYKEMLNRIR